MKRPQDSSFPAFRYASGWRRLPGLLLLASLSAWTGCNPSPSSNRPSTTTYVSPNPEQGGQFGVTVASVRDINGDGTTDVLVGAPNETVGGKTEAGRAYLFNGADGTLLRTLTAPTPTANRHFGGAVASLEDTNGDGAPELVVGAEGPNSEGRAYLIEGDEQNVLRTLSSPNPTENGVFALSSIVPVSDIDGDGVADLLIGAYGEDRSYLFGGATGQLLQTLRPPKEGGAFGGSGADVGDLDGDGVPDLLVGASAHTVDSMAWAGGAFLFSGASGERLRTMTSPNVKEQGVFGYSVASVGDVNGDDTPEYAVFARWENGGGAQRAGRVYLYDGATGDVLRTLASPNAQQRGLFGYSLAGIGDVTGDGRADLALTARKEDVDDAAEAGRVYLVNGATGDSLRTFTSPNAERKGQLGYSMAVARNASTDEATALFVGTYKESVDTLRKAGRVYRFRFR